MLEAPANLNEFYVVGRPEGNKCLVIFGDYKMELRDKSGSLLLECETKSKTYDKSIFEAYYNKE
jgi:hypothetical protein